MPCIVHIRGPCRLHFGMFSFGHSDRPQFGGVGVMVDPPCVEVTISPAAAFAAHGALAGRVEQFADALRHAWQLPALPACEINVTSPPDHVGLGVGTQLALAVAAGLRRFLAMPNLSVEELSLSIGRGTRSAVGTYGFRHGGLIVDAGKTPGQRLGTLRHRATLPDDWRVVLVRPGAAHGLAGDHEADAFSRLPPVADEMTQELWRIVEKEMLPGLALCDCGKFGDAVYRFGRLAGDCFAEVQGGPFAAARIAGLVDSIRNYGVSGVGQSSWGPTVFAFTPTAAEADALSQWLRTALGIGTSEIIIARPNNYGARFSTHS